jgi:lysosomal Pro-X carboxypeptidase
MKAVISAIFMALGVMAKPF